MDSVIHFPKTGTCSLQKSPTSPLGASGVARAFLGYKYANYTLKVQQHGLQTRIFEYRFSGLSTAC